MKTPPRTRSASDHSQAPARKLSIIPIQGCSTGPVQIGWSINYTWNDLSKVINLIGNMLPLSRLHPHRMKHARFSAHFECAQTHTLEVRMRWRADYNHKLIHETFACWDALLLKNAFNCYYYCYHFSFTRAVVDFFFFLVATILFESSWWCLFVYFSSAYYFMLVVCFCMYVSCSSCFALCVCITHILANILTESSSAILWISSSSRIIWNVTCGTTKQITIKNCVVVLGKSDSYS